MQASTGREAAAGSQAPPHRRGAIRVLVADDRAYTRTSLVDLLDLHRDISVVATCADGDEVLAAAERTTPDVALLDLFMPRRDGLSAARDLRTAMPVVRVLILSCVADPAAAREAHDLGAAGYLLKSEAPDALAARLRDVAGGGSAWAPWAVRALGAVHPWAGRSPGPVMEITPKGDGT